MITHIILGDEVPEMADLRTNVIKQYATYWKELGELLGVEDHDIVIIAANNKYNPNQSVDSCYEMLCKWRNKSCHQHGVNWRMLLRNSQKGPSLLNSLTQVVFLL